MSLSEKIFLKICASDDDLTRIFRHSAQEMERFNQKVRKTGQKGHLRGLIADLIKVRQESKQAYQQMSALQKEVHRARQVGSFVAGTMAAAYVLKEPVRKTMDFDLRMRHMSNTAFAGESLDQRRQGAKQLEAAVYSAIRQYGGTRDSAANAMDSIIASGVMNPKDTMAALPTIQKYATAFNAESEDMAAIVQAGVQNLGIDPKKIDRLFEIAGKGGQEGGYELKDMAKMLAEQSSAAAKMSLKGEEGFAHLIALNEVARTSAGTSDSAGTNVKNLLEKLKSTDTLRAFKNNFKVDLTKEYEKGLLEGKDSLDVYLDTIDKIVAKDQRFQKAMSMAAEAKKKGDKSEDTWKDIGDIVQSSIVGKVMRDSQAGAALAAMMSQREMMDDIRKKVLAAQGIGDDNFALISESNAFKTSQLANEKEIKTQEAFTPFNNALGLASEKLLEFANAFPRITTGITTAGYGVGAVATAGITGSIFAKVTGASLGGLFSKITSPLATVTKGAGNLIMKAGKGVSSFALAAGKNAGGAVIRHSPGVASKIWNMLSAPSSFGLSALFHADRLNQGEDLRMHLARQQYLKDKGNTQSNLSKNRAAFGFGTEISQQTASTIAKTGEAVVAKAQAVEQALLSKVSSTKIEGNINVRITAPAGFGVDAHTSGNSNTLLNLGMIGVGGG